MTSSEAGAAAVFAQFAPHEVEAALPLIFLGLAQSSPALVLPPEAEECIGKLVEQLGLTEQSTPEQMRAALDAYRAATPLPVLAALHRFLREQQAAGGDVGHASAALIGAVRQRGVLQSGARPAGTIPAGPGARFAVTPKRSR